MRTKQEILDWFNSQVGKKVPCKGNSSLDGQCVTLGKALLEFLGAPNPYKARGNANTVISAYLNEGIAKPGTGFISAFSSKTMAKGVGHIWFNAGEGMGTFYESNGAKPLKVTRDGCYYQYDSVCNFDQWIASDDQANSNDQPSNNQTNNNNGKDNMNELLAYLGVSNESEAKAKLKEHLGENDGKCDWGNDTGDRGGYLGSARRELSKAKSDLTSCQIDLASCKQSGATGAVIGNSKITPTLTAGGKTLELKRVRIDTATTNQVVEYE